MPSSGATLSPLAAQAALLGRFADVRVDLPAISPEEIQATLNRLALADQSGQVKRTSAFVSVDLRFSPSSTTVPACTSEVKAFTLEPEYTEVGRAIATNGNGFGLIEEMLRELAPFMDREREVVVDGFYDTESGRPAIMAKVRTTVEDAREVLTCIDRFQSEDWWWDHREVSAFDLILSVGA